MAAGDLMDLKKRRWWTGLKAGFRWIKNPVSEEGSTQVPISRLAIQGPDILKDVAAMRAHPVGSRLLRDKPNIVATLDLSRLATLPKGSFGKTYFDMMNHPDTLPGYLIAGLAYKDGFFDSLQIDADVRWYLERSFFDHDAMHILSGYGTDLTGEALNIMFIQGYQSGMSKRFAFLNPFGLINMIVVPNCGFRAWLRYQSEAFDRGRAARQHFPPHSIPYEDFLDKPLAEVWAYLGITPLPAGWDTSDWLKGSKIGERIASGKGKMAAAKLEARDSHAVVEAGVD